MADTADFKGTETIHLFGLEIFSSTTTTVKKWRKKKIPNCYISNITSNVSVLLSFYRLIKPSGKKEKHLQGCNIFPPWKLTDECCSAKPLTHVSSFYTTYRDFTSSCACYSDVSFSSQYRRTFRLRCPAEIAVLSVPHTMIVTSCDFY